MADIHHEKGSTMTSIKLHDDIYGKKSGETIDVSQDKADWAVANGYASLTAGGDAQQKLADATDVPMKQHQQNAEVRKDQPNKGLADQLADRDVLVDSKPEQDASTGAEQVEVENVDGDPAKAEKGKDALEKKAASQDPSKAPEQTNPDPVVEAVDEKQDKAAVKLEQQIKDATVAPAGADTE